MLEQILAQLDTIEQRENVQILYACEAGSRAWNFASPDSDWDVRFIYLRPIEDYLTISDPRDVLEYKDQGDGLDINGWDLRKALQLFRKSNPALLEWLQSPIVYKNGWVAHTLRGWIKTYFSPKASAYHYLNMARGNYRIYLQGDDVWIKKYLYVLRPILAVEWLTRGLGIVPMNFDVLVNGLHLEPDLLAAIDSLLLAKRAGEELRLGPRIAIIDDYIVKHLMTSHDYHIQDLSAGTSIPIEDLNELFQDQFVELERGWCNNDN